MKLACLCLIAAAALPIGSASAQEHPVVHVEVLGVNAERLQRFYGELFGWKITLNPIGYGYVPVAPQPPVVLTGGIGPGPQAQAIFYVKVDDPGAVLEKAAALGGRIVMAPVNVPGGITFARFADPEGNVIGLVRRNN